MQDKAFIDTNVLLYMYSIDEPIKRELAIQCLSRYRCHISLQVLNEFSNVCIKKWHMPIEGIKRALERICSYCIVVELELNTINKGLEFHEEYGYSYYDCLILAAANIAGCSYVLTEDMSHEQVINGKTTIFNVFASVGTD